MNPQPLHYCTHAATAFREVGATMEKLWPQYDQLEYLVAEWLSRAVVFQLPDNGQLFENRDYRPEVVDLIRLPYPMIALEFTADELLYEADKGLSRADKRIALAFSPQALPSAELAQLEWLAGPAFTQAPPGAIALLAVYAPNEPQEPLLKWGFAPGFLLWDPAKVPTDSAENPHNETLPEWAQPRYKSKHILPVDICPLPWRAAMLGLSPEQAQSATLNDSVDEISALWDALAALNCRNVGTVCVPAPVALNKKRQKQGRALFKDTLFLDIALEREPGVSRGPSGSHAAPRPHLRRGHLRHLPATDKRDALTLWINATHVRGGSTQQKPYRLRPAGP